MVRKDPDFRHHHEMCQAEARRMPQAKKEGKNIFYMNDPMVILINK